MNYREAWANGDIEAGTLVDAIEEQAREIDSLKSALLVSQRSAVNIATELRADIASKQLTIDGMNEAHWKVVQELAALKAQHEQDAQTIKVLQAMARQLKAQPSGVVPELRQVVTDALIGMIAAVTSSTPPANEPPPPFIQAAIDRAVDRIARLNSSPVSSAPSHGEQVRQMVPAGWNVERGCSPSGYVLHSPGGSMIRVCDSGMGGIETAFAMFLKALLSTSPSAGSQGGDV